MADEDIQSNVEAPAEEQAPKGEATPVIIHAQTQRKWEGPVPLLFEKYDFRDVEVRDPGLVRYINLQPIIVPHTGARHGNKAFAKHKMNIVERLINEMMRTEVYTGKKNSAFRATREAFEIVATRSKENPIQQLVKAIENAAPREEVTRLRYGGISVPKAVDVAPTRRLDQSIRRLAQGAVSASHKSKNSIAQCLADEILKAAKNDMNSAAVAKKEEIERVAKSAR
ncbi:MAG TPA: 30S ribosomal protein S7 [Candidatus Thermoplasmatota archaeon]|nr:30S ribosomal protein S7 [Candidatus Thermoplasmatota archaeon]